MSLILDDFYYGKESPFIKISDLLKLYGDKLLKWHWIKEEKNTYLSFFEYTDQNLSIDGKMFLDSGDVFQDEIKVKKLVESVKFYNLDFQIRKNDKEFLFICFDKQEYINNEPAYIGLHKYLTEETKQ